MKKNKILFVCSHNSARSQMAEAFLNEIKDESTTVQSAGLEPGKLNPIVVDALKEVGIDISGNQTKSVFDFYKNGHLFTHVITVCDTKAAESCPIFPGMCQRVHWSFDDPSAFEGSYSEKLEKTKVIRDQIKEKVTNWYKDIK